VSLYRLALPHILTDACVVDACHLKGLGLTFSATSQSGYWMHAEMSVTHYDTPGVFEYKHYYKLI
jgi:hypothetical protein